MSSECGCGVYVMMVLPVSNYLRFRNSLMRNSSILANYTGSLVCVAPEVKVVEGSWPGNRTAALLYFKSRWYAERYLGSDPLVRQPDFMDGIDVVLIDCKEVPPLDKNFYVISEVQVHDVERFINEYSPKTAYMREQGKVAVTAACPAPHSYRGTWKPNMLIVNQWKSENDYMQFYDSAEYQPLKELRQQISHSRVICLANTE